MTPTDVDFQIDAFSLPLVFRTRLETIPVRVPFADQERCIPLKEFAVIGALPGLRLVSLQAFNGLDQLSRLPPGMVVERLGEMRLFRQPRRGDWAAVFSDMATALAPTLGGAQ